MRCHSLGHNVASQSCPVPRNKSRCFICGANHKGEDHNHECKGRHIEAGVCLCKLPCLNCAKLGHNAQSSACRARDNFQPKCRTRVRREPSPAHLAGVLDVPAVPQPQVPQNTPPGQVPSQEDEMRAHTQAQEEAQAAEIACRLTLTQLEETTEAEELRAREKYHGAPEGFLCPSGLSLPLPDLEYGDLPCTHSPSVPQGSASGHDQC